MSNPQDDNREPAENAEEEDTLQDEHEDEDDDDGGNYAYDPDFDYAFSSDVTYAKSADVSDLNKNWNEEAGDLPPSSRQVVARGYNPYEKREVVDDRVEAGQVDAPVSKEEAMEREAERKRKKKTRDRGD